MSRAGKLLIAALVTAVALVTAAVSKQGVVLSQVTLSSAYARTSMERAVVAARDYNASLRELSSELNSDDVTTALPRETRPGEFAAPNGPPSLTTGSRRSDALRMTEDAAPSQPATPELDRPLPRAQ